MSQIRTYVVVTKTVFTPNTHEIYNDPPTHMLADELCMHEMKL